MQCIFVNIFGGLTLGDMIARGVLLAFQDLQMSVPVVVRIRGSCMCEDPWIESQTYHYQRFY